MKKKTKKDLKVIVVVIAVVFFVMILSLFSPYAPEAGTGSVALIKINGVIGEAGVFGSGVDPDEIVGLIQMAEENNRIHALLLEINSGGGSAVASEEIANAVKESKKPSIALIRDIGASGAYWIASAADVVIASPASLTGSLGVTASYLEFTGLMEKYGISYEELRAGEYKEIGSPFKTLTQKERDIFQEKLEELHEYFINSIKQNRNLDEDQTAQISTAMFYLGSEAKDLGLVDVLAEREEAEAVIKELLGVEKLDFVEYRKAKGFFELLSQVFASQRLDLRVQPVIQAR
jgi:protease-4